MHVFQPSPGLTPALLTKMETLSPKNVSACSQRIVQSSSFATSHLEKKQEKIEMLQILSFTIY